MAYITGNVHNLELSMPLPNPGAGGAVHYRTGRSFGIPVENAEGLDIWIDGSASARYPWANIAFSETGIPDYGESNIPLHSLIAMTHGFMQYVPAGEKIEGVKKRSGEDMTADAPTLALKVWPTLIKQLKRMLRDGSPLTPQTSEGKGGRPVPSIILYENVDTAILNASIEPLIKTEKPDPYHTQDVPDMIDAFLAGELPVLVRAGQVIGQAADNHDAAIPIPAGAHNFKRLTIKIADQFGQIISPGFFLRRMIDIVDVPAVPFLSNVLVPDKDAIENHPLPGMLPERLIIDFRDEYNEPLIFQTPAGPAGIEFLWEQEREEPEELETVEPKASNEWGLWLGEELEAGGDPLGVRRMSLGFPDEGLTAAVLPDAPNADNPLPRSVMADDYLCVQILDLNKWFAEQPNAIPDGPPRRYTRGNIAVPLIDGETTFRKTYRALRATFSTEEYASDEDLPDGSPLPFDEAAQNYIYLCNWRLSPDLHLPPLPDPDYKVDFNEQGEVTDPPGADFNPKGHIMGILKAAVKQGVKVRGLFWRQLEMEPNHKSNNTATVNAINAEITANDGTIKRGEAIRDNLCRATGSHHQKATVIKNRHGRVAFLGGIDLSRGRWDSTQHLDEDPRRQGGCWHDIHCMIKGPAVDDVEKNFRQRWNANPDSNTEGRTQTPLDQEQIAPIPGAPHFVSIRRTISPHLTPYNSFVGDEGELGCLNSRIKAIENARKYIYLQDQYLVMHRDQTPHNEKSIARAIKERLQGTDGAPPLKFVAILIPRELGEDPELANSVLYHLRRNFIEYISQGMSPQDLQERLLVFHLINDANNPTYVHAKCMLIDDIYLSIGSSNTGYRSMTYDVEINADIVDGSLKNGVRPLMRNFRIESWAEHLNLKPQDRFRVFDPWEGFQWIKKAADGQTSWRTQILRYDKDYFGKDDYNPFNNDPKYQPGGEGFELLRDRIVDPNGWDPDGPNYGEIMDFIAEG